jgi:hypothetical protein
MRQQRISIARFDSCQRLDSVGMVAWATMHKPLDLRSRQRHWRRFQDVHICTNIYHHIDKTTVFIVHQLGSMCKNWTAVEIAPSRRLWSRLLLHFDLHGRSYSSSCGCLAPATFPIEITLQRYCISNQKRALLLLTASWSSVVDWVVDANNCHWKNGIGFVYIYIYPYRNLVSLFQLTMLIPINVGTFL